MLKETLIKWLRVRIAALRGTRNLAVYRILSWFLRSVRLALHPARSINQCFLKNAGAERIIGFLTSANNYTRKTV